MLNATCQFKDPIYLIVIDGVGSCFSIPIYTLAFCTLFLKCPKFMRKSRNLLAIHFLSGLLLELNMGVAWKLRVPLPVPILCSAGWAAEYSQFAFLGFVYFVQFTAYSAISLFNYRMRAATGHVKKTRLQGIGRYLNGLFYTSLFTQFISTGFIYPDCKYQEGYKKRMESSLELKDYMLCDSCFFMRFDSAPFIVFFTLSYTSIVSGFTTGFVSAYVTWRALQLNAARLSAKTAAMQKNFLFSLLISICVHVTFILIPLATYFTANFIILNLLELGYICPMMLQLHGSAATLAMMLTSSVLRKSLFELLHCNRKSSPTISVNVVPGSVT